MKSWQYIALGGAIAVAVALSFCAGRYVFPVYRGVSVQRDTIRTTDTIRVEKPVPVVKEHLTTEYVQITDTLRVHDTLYVALPIERKVYEDSTYRAVVSGYRASLDEITVYQRTQTIYERVERTKKQRWTLGLSAGFGGFYGLNSRRFDAGPGLMLGVSYNF